MGWLKLAAYAAAAVALAGATAAVVVAGSMVGARVGEVLTGTSPKKD